MSEWLEDIEDSGPKEAGQEFEAPVELLKSYVELKGKDGAWPGEIGDETLKGVAEKFKTRDEMLKAYGDLEARGADGDWRKAVGEEHQKTAEKFGSPADVVKSYAELSKKLGDAITIPDKDASDEDRAAFWKRLGRPDDADKYVLARPEGITDVPDDFVAREKSFAAMAHGAGFTQAQVDGALSWYYTEAAAIEEGNQIAATKARETQEEAIDREWGDDKDTNDEFARRAAKGFGDDDFAQFLEEKKVDGVPLGDHPAFRRVFANIGRRMGEDTLMMGLPDDQKKGMQERIDELTALLHTDEAKYKSKPVQTELADLYLKLHGTGDVSGPARATLV